MEKHCVNCAHYYTPDTAESPSSGICLKNSEECLVELGNGDIAYNHWEPKIIKHCGTCLYRDPENDNGCVNDPVNCLATNDYTDPMYSHWALADDRSTPGHFKWEEVSNFYEDEEDDVNHPSHYTTGTIEVIDFLEDQDLDFRLANVIKYVCRYRHKGTPMKDLKKAQWYLNRFIEKLDSTIHYLEHPREDKKNA